MKTYKELGKRICIGHLKRLTVYWFGLSILFFIGMMTIQSNESLSNNNTLYLVSNFISASIALTALFMLYNSIKHYNQNFLKSSRREYSTKTFFFITVLCNLLIVLISSLVIVKYISFVKTFLSYKTINIQEMSNTFSVNSSWIVNFFYIFFVFVMISSLANLMGILTYKFKHKFWIFLVVLIGVVPGFFNIIGVDFNNIITLILMAINNFFTNDFTRNIIFIALTTIISYILGYFLLKKTDIK